jgi:aryl-alcohol dehydrogenase-like predicted oxidoreductase
MTTSLSRTLGKSDLSVFPLCLGGNTFGWTADAAESEAVLDAFVADGGNFVDTADGYSQWKPGNVGGESEQIIGDWMRTRGNRADIVLATKVSRLAPNTGLSAASIAGGAEASLRRLQTDYIDVYYAHYDDPTVPVEESAEAFNKLVVEGKVRHLALSNYTGERLEEFLACCEVNGFAKPILFQPHYNLVFRSEYESDMAPAVDKLGLSVATYYSLASGFLTGKYAPGADISGVARKVGIAGYDNPQARDVLAKVADIAAGHGVSSASVALAWLLTRAHVDAPIASARVVSQLPDLMAAPRLTLAADEVAALTSASNGL